MVDVVEEPTHIHFDQPLAARPGLLDGLECGMTGSSRAEPMRLVEEHRFVDRFEQNPDRLLNEPVFHRGCTQRSCFAFVLWDMGPPDWPEAISAVCYAPRD